MAAKKQPGRFTIQFNAADPQQRQVIELLNQQGRRQAAFLTCAVLAYCGQGAAPVIPPPSPPPSIEPAMIEQIVQKILAAKNLDTLAQVGDQPDLLPPTLPRETPGMPAAMTQTAAAEPELAADDLAAICNTIDVFRCK